MKKIFSVLFSMILVAFAFAQEPPELHLAMNDVSVSYEVNHSQSLYNLDTYEAPSFEGMTTEEKGDSYWEHTLANWPAHTSMFVVGASDGLADVLQFRYSRSVFNQDASSGSYQYWNPAVSYENKYTRNIPFGTTLLVGLTDGWHMSKTVRNAGITMAQFTYKKPPKGKWWYYAADAALNVFIRGAGWELTNMALTRT